MALFVVPCTHHSQECPPYVLKFVSPNPCRCFSTDGFHVWHSTSPPLPHEPSSQCPVKKQAASLTYWYFWHDMLFSFNPLTSYIAFTLDSGIIAKKESQEIWHFYCQSPPDLSICWKTWIWYATNAIQKQKKVTITFLRRLVQISGMFYIHLMSSSQNHPIKAPKCLDSPAFAIAPERNFREMRPPWTILFLLYLNYNISSCSRNGTRTRDDRKSMQWMIQHWNHRYSLFCSGQFSLFSIVQFPNLRCTSSTSSTTYGTCITRLLKLHSDQGWRWRPPPTQFEVQI